MLIVALMLRCACLQDMLLAKLKLELKEEMMNEEASKQLL